MSPQAYSVINLLRGSDTKVHFSVMLKQFRFHALQTLVCETTSPLGVSSIDKYKKIYFE